MFYLSMFIKHLFIPILCKDICYLKIDSEIILYFLLIKYIFLVLKSLTIYLQNRKYFLQTIYTTLNFIRNKEFKIKQLSWILKNTYIF
jgi:hypothetical protein